MRRSVVLLALPVAWVACFSSSSSGSGGGAEFDASEQDVTFPDGQGGVDATPEVGQDVGPDVGADVTVKDATADSMGPPQDASIDVPSPDAPIDVAEAAPAAVAITVFGATGPEAGVTIVYGDATGAVVGTPATTGATGMVSQPLPAGATMITALLGTATSSAPYTVMGVQPGDTIVVPDFSSLAPYVSGFMQVTALPAPAPPNATSYAAYAGQCSGTNTATPINTGLGASCIGLGMFGGSYGAAIPMLVEAIDANGNLAGFTFQKNNPLGGFDAGTLAVSLAADTWSTATTTQDVVVANAPDGSFVNTTVSESANAVLHPLSPQFVTDDAGVQHTLVTTHVGYADTLQVEATLAPTPQGAVATAVGAAPPTASASLTIDATPLGSLPTIANVGVDATTPAQPTITWMMAQGSLASTTGIIASASWQQLDEAGGIVATGVWTIVAPASGAGSIQAPALPASSSAYAPQAGATFTSGIQGLAGTVIPTYAQLRTVGAAVGTRMQGGCIMNPVLPFISTGTLSITAYSSGLCG